ncbi:MAG: Gfo/Idh/MocA family oxidoreductase [Planctomycetota bacterium]|nr:Gfo/Idh/MocA family oxidoreductase [Planctomycetota bacterium]
MSQKELKLGAVGTGGIWGAHATNLAAIGGNKVVAVCDVSDDNRKKWSEKLGAKGYSDIEALFAGEPELDGVIACTPPTVRLQVVEAAAKRGVPVLVEKPPAFKLADAAAINRIVEKTGAKVGVGFMYRYFASVARLKELIGDQPINMVQSSFFCPGATDWKLPGWFYIKERSGGHVLDQAIHVMDLVRYIAGDITQVYTVGTNLIVPKTKDFTIEDSTSTTMKFATGASGTHIHSWSHSQFTGFITVVGKEYRLTLELDNKVSGFVNKNTQVNETFPAQPQGCSHHYEEMKTFLEALRSKDFSKIRSPYVDASRSLATVLAMNESIETGKPVEVPQKV